MLPRRHLGLGALLLALAACAPKPPDFSYAATGAPLYQALSTAQQNMSNMAQYQGKPGEAAAALGQFQYIMARVASGNVGISMPPASQGLLQGADQEIRTALAIAPGTPPGAISDALTGFSGAYMAGDRATAMGALNVPFFTMGAEGTRATLGNLPPMRSVESASYALTRAAGTIMR